VEKREAAVVEAKQVAAAPENKLVMINTSYTGRLTTQLDLDSFVSKTRVLNPLFMSNHNFDANDQKQKD